MTLMIIFIHTTMCRDRQTDRPEKKQSNQYSSHFIAFIIVLYRIVSYYQSGATQTETVSVFWLGPSGLAITAPSFEHESRFSHSHSFSCRRSWSTHFLHVWLPWSTLHCARAVCLLNINMPSSFHCWKKPELDADELKNYRPVSNLTFVSKLVERVVASRLVSYLNDQDLMPQLQSAYRRFHSTETAGQSAYHGQSCCCTQPILFFLHPATQAN